MTPTALLVPTFRQMLQSLSGWLDKAAAERPDGAADALMSARLAPDMFPLSKQVRFACVQVHEAIGRLTDQPYAPAVERLLAEGRNGGDSPGTLAEAKARIAETIETLDALAAHALDASPDKPVAHALPMGLVFDFSAEQYARDWTLAQFYFHVMTAYAILRAQGVALGKADYVGHLLPYVRPGTMPGER